MAKTKGRGQKRLALDKVGNLTTCCSAPENMGERHCFGHLIHQQDQETVLDFAKRVRETRRQKGLSENDFALKPINTNVRDESLPQRESVEAMAVKLGKGHWKSGKYDIRTLCKMVNAEIERQKEAREIVKRSKESNKILPQEIVVVGQITLSDWVAEKSSTT